MRIPDDHYHDELLNIRGLSRVLHLPPEWLKREADEGRIPCLRVGRRRLFSLGAVMAALLRRAASETIASEGETSHG